MTALESLENCDRPNYCVEVIVVLNHSENESKSIKQFNYHTAAQIENWIKEKRKYDYHLIKAFDLPAKKAGVGLARKIGMDEAVRRFDFLNEENGVIVCYDADCTCSPDYLRQIEQSFCNGPVPNAGLAYFEHNIKSKNPKIDGAIVDYELHLRYYVQALKYAGFPFAYHTVGSCICVPSNVYQKQGGMNTRKAGEDFYFLQRVFPLGNIENINSAKVYPSSRPSDRVPFGTGRAVGDIICKREKGYYTYNPQTFMDFMAFNNSIEKFWKLDSFDKLLELLPDSLVGFLQHIDFSSQIAKIKSNSTNPNQFKKALYNWFNGFKALKFVHFARDNYHQNVEVLKATNWLLAQSVGKRAEDKIEALILMRALDRSE